MAITVTKISDVIYQFNEAMHLPDGSERPYVDAYLYLGTCRAALIDTLQNEEGLYEEARKITDLPVDVLITHGHGDHVGRSLIALHEAGCKIYMSMSDFGMVGRSVPEAEESWFTPLHDGDEFFFGDRRLTTIACAGHTPGCVVFFDKDNRILFSGDTVGSGSFWMQLPTCIPLAQFEGNVKRLLDLLTPFGLSDILIYPGHRVQSPTQLVGTYVRDCWFVAQGIMRGTIVGEKTVLDMPGRHMEYLETSHGQMLHFCYDPDNLRMGQKTTAARDAASGADEARAKFEAKTIRDGSYYMQYMQFTPAAVKDGTADGKKFPLVVYLHGGGERGTDVTKVLANTGAWGFALDAEQAKHPCYIVAPQVADGSWTSPYYQDMIKKLVEDLVRHGAVDANRVYVTGLSMGGGGTWGLLARFPEMIAAAVPICGFGDPLAIRAAKNVPVWAFHAVDDPVVECVGYLKPSFFNANPNLCGTRYLVTSLRGTGNPDVRYTEYPAGYMAEHGLFPHASWVPAYETEEMKEWLFSQSRVNRYDVEMVQPGFYWIEDFNDDSMYVVEGTERALVVDTGLAENDFTGMVTSLTNLPYDLAVTHCHGDHMYHLPKFDRYYMSPKDVAVLEMRYTKKPLEDLTPGTPEYEKAAATAAAMEKPEMIAIHDGDIIDLGGGYEVEVFDLGGHTPGSVCFLDKKRRIMMTGDALGCWMQVTTATTIGYYREQLVHFLERMSAPEYADVVMMGGHRKQEGLRTERYGSRFVPNDLQKVRDMITLCDKLLNDEIEYVPFVGRNFGEPSYSASYGQASMVFKKSGLTVETCNGEIVPLP